MYSWNLTRYGSWRAVKLLPYFLILCTKHGNCISNINCTLDLNIRFLNLTFWINYQWWIEFIQSFCRYIGSFFFAPSRPHEHFSGGKLTRSCSVFHALSRTIESYAMRLPMQSVMIWERLQVMDRWHFRDNLL